MPIFQKNLNRVCPILENPMQLTKHPFLSLPFRSPSHSPFDGKTVPQPEWKQTN